MASGRTHDKISQLVTYSTLTATGLAMLSRLVQFDLFTLVTIFTSGQLGRVVTPDLDVGRIYGHYLIRRYFGRVVEAGWYYYWLPYSLLPHRSPLSHWPLIGTVGRIMYLSIPLLAVDYILKWQIMAALYSAKWYILVGVGILAILDLFHFLADLVPMGDW